MPLIALEHHAHGAGCKMRGSASRARAQMRVLTQVLGSNASSWSALCPVLRTGLVRTTRCTVARGAGRTWRTDTALAHLQSWLECESRWARLGDHFRVAIAPVKQATPLPESILFPPPTPPIRRKQNPEPIKIHSQPFTNSSFILLALCRAG